MARSSGFRISDMCDETRSGIILGLALASNPRVTARREAYFESLRADRAMLARLDRGVLEAAATGRGLITIPGVVGSIELSELTERIARCLQSSGRGLWLEALGVGDPETATPSP